MHRALKAATMVLVVLLALGSCARSPEAKKARYLERGDRYFKTEKFREAVLEYRNALRIESNNAHASRQLGLAYYQLGELAQAYRYLLKAQEQEPGNPEIRVKLAQLYLVGGRAVDARNEAQQILEKEPKNLDALTIVAAAAQAPEEIDRAIRQLDAVRGSVPAEAKLYLALGGLYLRKGDLAAAERAFRDAVTQVPKSIEAHTALGNFFLARRDTAQAEREFKAAADLAPAGSAARVKLADYYLLLGRREEAKATLKQITEKAPSYLPAWRLLASIALAEGKVDESESLLKTVFEKNSSDLEARALQGRVYLARGDADHAIEEFQRVLKSEPGMAPVRYQLALAQLRSGNVQQAKAELRETISRAPNYTDAVLLLAEINIQTGAASVAMEDLEKLIARQPSTTTAYSLLSAAYLGQRDPAKALAVARKFAQVAPKDPRAPYLSGTALMVEGKRAAARREFEVSLALAPGFLEPLSQLTTIDLAERQGLAALDRVKKQIAFVPKSGAHFALLGYVQLALGDPKSAENAYKQAIALSPRMLEPYLSLGNIYASSQRYHEALAKLAEAAKISPKDPTPLLLTGVVQERLGDIPQARQAYEQALARNPRFAAAANNLAWLYSEYGGDQDKALSLAQTAKQVAPDDPRVSDTLGWILHKRGVNEQALALLSESAKRLPDNPQVQYHLGVVQAKLGDTNAARRSLQRAVASPESFRGKEEAKSTLANLN